jgi:hypothetical protein
MCQKRASPESFNQLIGVCEQCRWQLEAERLGSCQINKELEPGRLLHGKLSWLGALQYFVDIDSGAAEDCKRLLASCGTDVWLPGKPEKRYYSRQFGSHPENPG